MFIKSCAVALLVLGMGAACHRENPQSPATQQNLQQNADATLGEMMQRDPAIDNILHNAYAYVVFPEVGKGGLIVGGAYGKGILFERGQPTGYVELQQGSIGAQAGGETFAELIVLKDQDDVQRLKAGNFDLGANASAVVLKEGASANTDFRNGTAVFVMPRGGLMVDVSVSGQKINFQPMG